MYFTSLYFPPMELQAHQSWVFFDMHNFPDQGSNLSAPCSGSTVLATGPSWKSLNQLAFDVKFVRLKASMFCPRLSCHFTPNFTNSFIFHHAEKISTCVYMGLEFHFISDPYSRVLCRFSVFSPPLLSVYPF